MDERAVATTRRSQTRRHYTKRLSAKSLVAQLLGVVFVLYIVYLFASGDIQWLKVWEFLFHPKILIGVLYTIVYSVLAMVAGVLGGLVLVVAIMSHNPVWDRLAKLYIALFRALPLIVLLLIFYNIAIFLPYIRFGIPGTDIGYQVSTNVLITPFMAAVIGLALHEAAYMAEIIRAGINSVDAGQLRAARSIGMTFTESLRWIIFPQAIRIIIPPTANEFVSMLKNTSLVVVIAGSDLLTVAKTLYSQNFLTMELLFVASIWYLVMVLLSTAATNYLEKRYGKGFN